MLKKIKHLGEGSIWLFSNLGVNSHFVSPLHFSSLFYASLANTTLYSKIIQFLLFRDDWQKSNIEWKNGDNSIEYNQLRYFKFLPKESKGQLRDQVVIPNIPMIVSYI